MGEAVTSRPIEELMAPMQIELLKNPARAFHASAPAVVTPMEMLNRALEQGADIGLLEKLMALQERWEANQAKKAFDAALAAAKGEIPTIVRNAKGHNDKMYADFSAIAKAIDPILGTHGLSYRFRTQQADRIVVTCILSHKDGHAEETTLAGPADTTGNKNAIQAIGSTLTYLQRYTLVQMLGLAAAADDDGKRSGAGSAVDDDQLEQLHKALLSIQGDEAKFCQMFKIENLSDLPASKFKEAVDTIRTVGRKKANKDIA